MASKRSGRTSRKGKAGRRKAEKVLREYVGKVQMTREGFVFVIVEGLDDDIFVKAAKTLGALNGDVVKVAVTKEKTERQRMEGKVTQIVERSRKPFVGILHIVGSQAWVLMQSRVMPYDISVTLEGVASSGASSGMKVSVVVDSWPRGKPNPVGHIVDVLGEPGENDTEMHAILAEFGLPYRFEPEVENAADSISETITGEDLKGRRDFRDVLTFTIDPADAKDFDDALSFRLLENGNYEVGVHIADVTYYVKPGSIVEEEARRRATSVYLVDRTVPMLPEKLSNKLCSLRPGEEKLTFSAVFELTPLARVVGSWFGRTIINSDYRFAYETAQQVIDAGKKAMHHHVGIASDRRCEMGVVLECQSVVSDVLSVISRLCHCPEREQFYGIELRSVLRLSKEAVQFAGYLLAVVCRSECVAEIADEGAEVVKFQLVRFIVHAVNKGLGIFLSAFVAAGSTLAARCHKFRHAAVGQEHKLFNEPVGFFRNLLIDTHRAALFIHLDLHFRAFKADCT